MRAVVAGEPAQQPPAQRGGCGGGQFRAQPLEGGERRELGAVGSKAALGGLARVTRAEHVGRFVHSSW
jgi:hypothetical protein